MARQATSLASLEQRDRVLTQQILAQRNQVAALHAALLNRQIAQMGTRAQDAAKLRRLTANLHSLEAQAAAAARRAAAAAPPARRPAPTRHPASGSAGSPSTAAEWSSRRPERPPPWVR